jgi:Cft2 family RNA processing exonuclease
MTYFTNIFNNVLNANVNVCLKRVHELVLNLKKKIIRPCDLNLLSHGTCCCVCMSINAVANSIRYIHIYYMIFVT